MITINVSKMFAGHEPWDCSNSQANLGDQAGRLTWATALRVAESAEDWLCEDDSAGACDAVRQWAREAGAWDREEIQGWSEVECLALLVQLIAGDLRLLGSDDNDLEACVNAYEAWDHMCESPHAMYYLESDGTDPAPVKAQWSPC